MQNIIIDIIYVLHAYIYIYICVCGEYINKLYVYRLY